MVNGKKRKGRDEGINTLNTEGSFPIVALGSSAGGLEATEAFFKNTPPDLDMAYIVIAHLEPHYPSLLAEIISKSTTMEAVQAQKGIAVQKNKIYVIPPGKDMIITGGVLRLFDRKGGPEPFLPIDFFLRSLAEERKENAIAIILSGNASDGSLGIRYVHANMGMIMVQSPETAKYDSMPHNAIDTGIVDYVLPPEDMPGMIVKYIHALRTRTLPPKVEPVGGTDIVQKIIAIIKTETGHDFSHYKKSTINRRIERRMNVHQLGTMEQYVSYLKTNSPEVHLLFKEILIEVTNFFRNSEAFESLKGALRKKFFVPGTEIENIRVWVTACSTGEEAYSIAIILRELMDEAGQRLRVQIFGSDINEDAINTARAGDYPNSIANDVGEVRLDKYFTKHDEGYKVKKGIREMVLFAPHDVTRDPPFLHLDILSCRNLLIYFEPSLQRKVLETFSTAMNPGGILFLGESESVTGFDDRFIAIDSKSKLYRRKPYTLSTPLRDIGFQHMRSKGIVMKDAETIKGPSMNEKVQKLLLLEHTPPSLIVNEKNEVIYFHGRTSKYLGPAQGRASLSIRDLLREDLRYIVMSSIDEARSTGTPVMNEAVHVNTDDGASFLNIIIRPVEAQGPSSNVLVVFNEMKVSQKILENEQGLTIAPFSEKRNGELEKELSYIKENLRNTIEKLETSNEELTSTNEELQSNNEELQTVVEELETGKEELNSLNEELLAVNSELERKNKELSVINSDMRNLLNSIEEALIFLDNNLRIRRFTPQMKKITNLLPVDVNRPIQDITMNLRYTDLVADVKEVLHTLNTKEKEVQTMDGRWYNLRILPYRTVDNVIDGVVVTFSDIDSQKNVQRKYEDLSIEAQISQAYAESIVNTVKEPLLIMDEKLIIRSANSSFYRQFKAAPENIHNQPFTKILDGMLNIRSLIDRLNDLITKETELENLRTEVVIPKLGKIEMEITARKLVVPSGKSTMILVSIPSRK
ncbi:MAG TPA: CheR family methyltransferase [Methanomassiliicoccales archaeon]|nr:CheR family methyltransferase [Methanomassiliicoccales archaeon]